MAQQVLLAPPTERILSQAESLAVVQIFLNASLACIAHTRELIPWTSSCFRTRYVDQITLESDSSAGESLYSAFQSLAPESPGEGQEVKLLVRGGHRCADQMLDMLVNPEHSQQTSRSPLISSQEQGVFDALDQSYLDSLRVFVTDAAQRQPSIIETYHFAFAYKRGTVTSVHLSSVAQAFVLENNSRALGGQPSQPQDRVTEEKRRKIVLSNRARLEKMGSVSVSQSSQSFSYTAMPFKVERQVKVETLLTIACWPTVGSDGLVDRVASAVNAEVSIDQVQCWQHKECYGRGDSLSPATIPEEHFCYTCLLFSEGLKPPNSPLLIILLRVATGYLAAKTTPGLRIAGDFLQTQLKPFRWTREVLDWAMERLVEEGLLKPVSGGFFEVVSLDDAEMWQVKERCMGSLASVKGLFETCTNPDNTRRNDLLSSLRAYAGENDYTTAEGCEELISYDEFGGPVYRWGYDTAARNPSLEKPVVEKELTTPVRRRKISISRILINIDRSPSAASMSLEESTNRFRDNRSYSTDCSTAASTATAD
ncbi:hypothetical protein AYO20_04054 [Fonsecaea nubica]|uniref:HORMA domain-containing protein n=1 Tax=Fonsecaea nubica TaxID=856822 RepID=A0A178D564_9EURO|nr:hypothetical protein AYO20_04054 [Fonsecaea nubica]OAL36722.1 hypothetical protein AYO20_04054 [Fonsecaea nubica]